ncbi:hypothetical protein ABPG74_011664 [Tetrahymena malaccensis]
MNSLLGWVATAVSTGAGSYGDLVKKRMSLSITVWDSVAITNFFGFFYLLFTCILTNSFPLQYDYNMVVQIFITSIFKIVSQACFYMSVNLAPLSTSIPYLSWNSLFLLVTGYFYLDEVPSYLGVVGCVLILIGAYIKQIDSKTKELNKENYYRFNLLGKKFKLSGAFFMIIVSLIWTYTTTKEKHIMVHLNLTPSFLLLVQRIFISFPLMFMRYLLSKKQFTEAFVQNFKSFSYLSFIENISTGLHFKAMELLYVSYVTAAKRAGTIIMSTFLGYQYLQEKLTNKCLLSNLAMAIGILFIVLGK